MFFLCFILSLIILLNILFLTTTIKVDIQNINFSTDKVNGRYLNKDYKILLNLYLLDKIKFLEIDITKLKMESKKIKKNISRIQDRILKNKNEFDINILDIFKYINLKIRKLTLKIEIGTEDASLTAKSVGIISAIIAIVLGNFMKSSEKNYWEVMPIYQNRNFLNVYLDCIFELKLIHIIYTIYIIKMKGDKNGRTSNRRSYAYSDE